MYINSQMNNQMWHNYSIDYYLAIKRDEILIHDKTGVNLQVILPQRLTLNY